MSDSDITAMEKWDSKGSHAQARIDEIGVLEAARELNHDFGRWSRAWMHQALVEGE